MAEAPRELTPPPIQAPTAKEKKYDRQLRLWAAAGQRALEESHVLLVVGETGHGTNSSIAGVETLKNLVLPSIGRFTIADAAKVQEADLGVNFFLEPGSLGKSRAQETTRLLNELNEDVKCFANSEPASLWISDTQYLKQFNLIIVCAPLAFDNLEKLSKYASDSSIPLIYLQSVGLYSSFSIQLPTYFPIVDTHPDPDTTSDLRLLAPWPELSAHLQTLGDINTLKDHVHGHIPYLLILLHYLKQWHAQHGSYPSSFKEKTAFRDLVRSGARTQNPEGGEENFDEACAAVLKTIAPPPVGSGCQDMFAMPECINPTANSTNFWLIANAIKSFYDKHSVLPLPGSLPDMKATSEGYITLQHVYKRKALQDLDEVIESIHSLQKSLNRDTLIPTAEISLFCKNASHIRVLTNLNNHPIPSLRLHQADPKTISALKSVLDNDWENMLPVFVALNASDLSFNVEDLTNDEEKQTMIENCTMEVQRMKGGELHNISSVTGGMVAQEAIKLLTRQYVPVDGTAVYDGIRGKVGVFKL